MYLSRFFIVFVYRFWVLYPVFLPGVDQLLHPCFWPSICFLCNALSSQSFDVYRVDRDSTCILYYYEILYMRLQSTTSEVLRYWWKLRGNTLEMMLFQEKHLILNVPGNIMFIFYQLYSNCLSIPIAMLILFIFPPDQNCIGVSDYTHFVLCERATRR